MSVWPQFVSVLLSGPGFTAKLAATQNTLLRPELSYMKIWLKRPCEEALRRHRQTETFAGAGLRDMTI